MIGEGPTEGLGDVLGWRMGSSQLVASGVMCSMMALRRSSGLLRGMSTGMKSGNGGQASGPLGAFFKALQAQKGVQPCLIRVTLLAGPNGCMHASAMTQL